MEYNFREIESRWQQNWQENGINQVSNSSGKPKFYVLDMFPYPSGAGLHVGHPLGYIASDIYARYKRLKGFNVLHPMGFDSFGLPAEQYALETGQHPVITTEKNIATFKAQLDKIGFSFDWSREIKTSDPEYYRWTQWIFLQIFNSWFNPESRKAEPIESLVSRFESNGSLGLERTTTFSAQEWRSYGQSRKQEILMDYRLAYSSFGEVNWCEALGTVLANDEVTNGVSERGGFPVEKKKMRQWYLRITDYADRLLEGLEKVDFSEAMKEMQRNWIGRSEGAELEFALVRDQTAQDAVAAELAIKVYTTRPDTIFGVDFLVLAPEHELVDSITTPGQRTAVNDYLHYVKSRSDRERMAEVKQITGCFTGAYALNPFNGKKVPVWIAEYVLSGYGTGAIMAVPCGDQRDFDFASHFSIPITNIIGEDFNGREANPTKEAVLQNSGFLDGMFMKDAISAAIEKIEELNIGKRKVNYKMRDAGFSRQRYWGEPFPIIWNNGTAIPLPEKELPLELPFVEKYGPGKDGEGPLSNLTGWVTTPYGKRETSTMPGYAGSSWYFLRYMDPRNNQQFAERKATDYWNQVDVYIGGTEHAVGHLLYSRLWTKILFDLGYIGFDEPYKKLVNQGMITGKSYFIQVVNASEGTSDESFQLFSSAGKSVLRQKVDFGGRIGQPNGVSVPFRIKNAHHSVDAKNRITERNLKALLDGDHLVKPGYIVAWEADLTDSGERYVVCELEVEKMSKSKFNVDNPDDIVQQYGADTFRMYEMFLGPVEQSKPWDTKGIEGVHRFLKKLWRLFFDEQKGAVWVTEKAESAELKVLHRAIKKIEEDTERFSFNTAISAFMVCVNDLSDLKCHKKEILEPLLILLTPYAPHISEELYHALGNTSSVLNTGYPKLELQYLVESEKEYPVSVNGKLRTTMTISLDAGQQEVEHLVLDNPVIQKWIDDKTVKKIIFIKNKMINVVV